MTGHSVLKLFHFPAIMDAKQQTAEWLRELVNSCSPKGNCADDNVMCM